MIHRQNWLDVRDYLQYIERVRQNDIETVKRARSHLRHLLEWADSTPFFKARGIDPTFPSYLVATRSMAHDQPLAPASIVKGLANARQFFAFARAEWPLRYRALSESWIDLLQPPRHVRSDARPPVRKIYDLETVLKIAAVSTATLREDRGQVAVCMLFLSGMRADALASLPISCVLLGERAVHQFPLQGVRTKNRKAAITFLLDIPEVYAVVERWDRRVRSALPADALWYATLARDGMSFTVSTQTSRRRYDVVEEDVRLICDRAGVEYQPPHRLRHGHVVWALKHARTLADLKAISQNVMHSSVTITDGVYGNLVRDDVRTVISRIGKQKEADTAELLRLLDALKAQIS
ncbi:MAG: site-specific integrase [Chloroflexi bacterium CFX2]|nr:site-specific integrase [Chloroflexi bacterium CFX2]